VIALSVGQLPVAVSANDAGRRIILASRDVMLFETSGIAFTAIATTRV
jgi:hypothetical protein